METGLSRTGSKFHKQIHKLIELNLETIRRKCHSKKEKLKMYFIINNHFYSITFFSSFLIIQVFYNVAKCLFLNNLAEIKCLCVVLFH